MTESYKKKTSAGCGGFPMLQTKGLRQPRLKKKRSVAFLKESLPKNIIKDD